MKKLLSYKPVSNDFGLLLLRIFSGGMMAFYHGWPKLQKFMEGSRSFADPIGLGEVPSFILTILAELVCGLLIVLGWVFRPALIMNIITMFVVVFVIRGEESFKDKENAVLFLVAFLVLFFTGSGKYALDAKGRK